MNAIASQIVNRLSSMLAADLERYAKNRVASGQLGFGFKSDDRLTGQKTFGWKEEQHPRAADGKFATEENKGEKAEEPENQAQVEEKPEDKPAEKTDREKLIEKAEQWSTPGDNYDRQIRNHLTRLKSVMERGFDETSVGYHERELQQAVDAKEAREAQATSEPEVDEEEADSEPPFDPMQAVKVSADSIDRLRKQDVQRVIEWTPEEHRGAVADFISKERPDLADEVSEVVGELNGGEEPQAQAEGPAEPEGLTRSNYVSTLVDKAKERLRSGERLQITNPRRISTLIDESQIREKDGRILVKEGKDWVEVPYQGDEALSMAMQLGMPAFRNVPFTDEEEAAFDKKRADAKASEDEESRVHEQYQDFVQKEYGGNYGDAIDARDAAGFTKDQNADWMKSVEDAKKPAAKSDLERDTAISNVQIDKRGGGSLDSQIDKWKAEEAKKARAKAKEDTATKKSEKARARELFDQHAQELAERTAAKSGKTVKEVKHFIDQQVKWEPDKAIKMLEGFAKQKEAEGATAAAPEPVAEPASDSRSAIDKLADHQEKIRSGNATAAEVRDWHAWASSPETTEEIRQHLNGKTIAQLKAMGAGSYWSKTKKEFVEDGLRKMQEQYHVGQSLTHGMGPGAREEALRKAIANQTDDDIKGFSERVTKATEERKARIEQITKAIKDPQTLEDFKTRQQFAKDKTLTPEMQERYDELVGTTRRASEKAKAETVAPIQGVSGVTAQVKEGFNAKKGKPTHVVTLDQRVEKDKYYELNAAAKKLGGYYSNFRGAGAIPGFQFDTPEAAKKFQDLVHGQKVDATPEVESRAEEKATSQADTLRERAESIKQAAEEELSKDRKTNTERRAESAAHIDARNRQKVAQAETMAKVADGIASGNLKHLGGVKAATHVDELTRALNRAKQNTIRQKEKDPSYMKNNSWSQRDSEWQRDATIDDVANAEYPHPRLHANTIREISTELAKVPGLKQAAATLGKHAKGSSDRVVTLDTEKDIDALRQVATKLKGHPNRSLKWLGEKAAGELESYNRFQQMGIKSLPELRAALREYHGLKTSAPGEDPIKAAERRLVGRKIDGFFPTPRSVVESMLDKADIKPGMSVLEPSAGKGDILDAVKDRHGASVTTEAIEPHGDLRDILSKKGHNVQGRDFLEHKGQYDRIVMNPPFENSQDIAHVKHAYEQLAPGGKLVAVVSAGGGKKRDEFDEWVNGKDGEIEALPQGSFASAEAFRQTGVNTRLVTISKPAAPVKYSMAEQIADGIRERIVDRISMMFHRPEQYAKTRTAPGQMSFGFVTKGTQRSMQWKEEEHPRDAEGKFATEEGNTAKAEEPAKEPEEPEALAADDQAEEAPADLASEAEEAFAEDMDDSDPRQEATEDTEEDAKSEDVYAFARESAIPNMGEDVLGSARHKRNQWKGLEEAEKDGTAEEMVTRDKLLKNEPHGLAIHADRNPMTAMAMHYAIRSIPEKPGYGTGAIGPKEREQYLELYRMMKEKAQELAQEEPDPKKAVDSLRGALLDKVRELRGQKDNTTTARAEAKDRYNQTANAILGMVGAFETYRSRPKANTVMGKTMAFVAQAAKAVPEMMNRELPHDERAAAFRLVGTAAIAVMSGKSVPQAFGTKSTRAQAGFSEMAQYVASAERKGGKDVSQHTASGEKAAKHLGDSYGLRGVQWGNSLTDEERKHHAVKTVEAFTDLADVLGLKPEDVSLGGHVALGVGSRGKGGTAATYWPDKKFINLNRSSGVGTLAHEWGHAFDHSVAGFKGGGMGFEDYSRSSNGTYSSTEHRDYHPAMKGLREAMESSGYRKRLIGELQKAVNEGNISATKANKYWMSDAEMFARSFERHVQEKLEGRGQKNTYLAGLSSGGGFWPTPEESAEMAPHFDKLFATFRKQKYGSEEPQKFSRAHLEQSIRMILEGVTEDYAKHKSAPGQLGFGFVSKGGQHSIKWDESKHPRAEDGKFGHGSGNSSNTAEPEPEKDSQTDEVRVEPQAAPAEELSPEDDYKANGTRAKAFKNWFGDWENDPANSSKVVDPETGEPQETAPIDGKGSKVMEDGKPIAMYHGTPRGGFDQFDRSKLADPDALLYGPGFYFTSDISIAEEYMEKERPVKEWGLTSDDVDTQANRDKVADALRDKRLEMEATRKRIYGEGGYAKEHVRFTDQKNAEQIEKDLRNGGGLIQSVAPFLKDDGTGRNDWEKWEMLFPDLIKEHSSAEIKEVYLNIRNPLDVENGGVDFDKMPAAMKSELKAAREKMTKIYRSNQVMYGEAAARNELKAKKEHEDFVKAGGPNITADEAEALYKRGGDPEKRKLMDEVNGDLYDKWMDYKKTAFRAKLDQQMSTRYAGLIKEVNRPHASYDELVNHMQYKGKVQEFLSSLGYDGITHTGGQNLGNKSHRVWIAFEPHQIKATDNKGTFDPSDNRMKYRNEGERWITIGGGPKGEDGKRNPHGFPVKIDGDGRIVASRVSGLQGKLISGVKDHFAEMRSTAESHDHARRSARAHGAKPSEVRKLMPQAHQFIKDQVALRETARTHARNLSKLNSGVIAKIENAHRDWSTVEGFDSVARDVAIAHPELGFDPDDTDTPGKVWELIREGKEAIPTKDSREVAELAAQWAKHSGTTKTKEVHPEDSLEFSRARSGETSERYAFQESQHPRNNGGEFTSSGAGGVAKNFPTAQPERKEQITQAAVKATAAPKSKAKLNLSTTQKALVGMGYRIDFSDPGTKFDLNTKAMSYTLVDKLGQKTTATAAEIKQMIKPVKAAKYAKQMGMKFDESKHPRDDGGEFATKADGSAGPAPAAAPAAVSPDRAPWSMSPDELKQSGIQFYRTGQGSTYAYHPTTGQTIRVKTAHAGHDAKDVGLKKPSERTVYIDPEHAKQIGMWQTSSAQNKRIVIHNGHVYLTSKNAKTGAQGMDEKPMPFSHKPVMGQSPLELNTKSGQTIIKGGEHWSGNHPGSPITDMGVPHEEGHRIMTEAARAAGKTNVYAPPAAKPKLTAVAGMQQGLFGGGERAGGQKSLFNVVHPTSKAKPTGSSEPKPTGRMAEFLAKKDTVSPADLAVPLAPPSLPGQKKLFSRGQSDDFDEAEHPRNESGQFIEKDGDDSGRVKMRQAKAGGEVSEVDGQHYKGGRWMPVHGLYSGQEKPEKKPKQEGSSGPVFASESSKGPVMARQLSPEQVEAERARQQEQKDWDTIQAGPLGKLLHLGDEPHNIRHTHGDIRKWAELFESGDITTDSLEDATDYARDQVQQIEEAKSAMTAEDWDYYSGWINEHAERDRSDYAPRQIKKLLNAHPAITDARSWLSTLMESRQDIDTLKEINDRLAGSVAKYSFQESEHPREANGEFANKQGAAMATGNRNAASHTLRQWIGSFKSDLTGVTAAGIKDGTAPESVMSLYQETQEKLKADGVETVDITRGIAMKSDLLTNIIRIGAIDLSQAASWTTDRGAAAEFVTLNGGNGKIPVIIEMEAPSSDVIASHDIQDEFSDVAKGDGHTFAESEVIAAIGSGRIASIEIDGYDWDDMDDEERQEALQSLDDGEYKTGVVIRLSSSE